MKNIQKIWNKTITYYLVMATVTVFIFSEFIYRGPFVPLAKAMDGMKIKYALMAVTSLYILMQLIAKRQGLFKMNVFRKESILYLIAIGSLAVITLFYQIINGFRAFVIPEFMYVLLPLLFVILIVSADCINITRVLDNCFYVTVAAFLIDSLGVFESSEAFSLSVLDSSSPFENPSSLIFVFLELYFLVRYNKRNGKALICLIITILTFKRFSVLIALLFFIFIPMIKDKKVPRWVFALTIIIFCAMPFLLMYFYSNEFASFFFTRYQMDFNEFTMDRFARTSYVLNHTSHIKYGFGSVSQLLTDSYGKGDTANRSLHSDILRIYLECSFVGTFIYNTCYFLSVRKSAISFLFMVSIFVQMIFNHPIGAGAVGHWIIIYLIIAYLNYRKEVPFYKEGMIKRRKIKLGKLEI